MIDPGFIGYTTEATRVKVDAWRVKLFCLAIGETDPAYLSERHPVPPTFLKALESEHCNSAVLLRLLKVPVNKVLHAEQSFEYHQPVCVGDEVLVSRTVSDLYDKRGGAMSFIVVTTHYRVGEVLVASSVQTILVRNEVAVAA